MSWELRTEPIDRWPLAETKERQRSPFSANYSDTQVVLARELDAIGARGVVVLQLVTRRGAGDVRRDGNLRADARIDHPGVRLSFQSRHGTLTYGTDRFTGYSGRPAWHENLRAIALGLEALRKPNRYGIVHSDEQYRGWRAIEAPGTTSDPRGVLRKWALHYPTAETADPTVANEAVDKLDLQTLVRWARVGAHPDRHGGDSTPHNEIVAAARQLGVDL